MVINQCSRRTRILALLLPVLLAMPAAASEPGGATPEEVYERFVAAATEENWQEMASCVSPEGLVEMNASMVAVGGMVIAFAAMGDGMAEEMGEGEPAAESEVDVEKLEQQFEELLARHGIDEETMEALEGEEDAPMPEAFESPEFFADLMGFIDSIPGDESGGMTPPEGELENLVIAGDSATASVGGNEGGFVRIDGRWYIDMSQGEDEDVEPEMEEEAAE